jgi:hypothetical protein
MNPRPSLRLFAGLLAAVLLLGGCYSRKEAALVTNRLGTASQQAGKLVAQMRTADADNVAAIRELHAAFLSTQQALALDAVGRQEDALLRAAAEKQAGLLGELHVERGRFLSEFATSVNEAVKPLREREIALGKVSEAARQAAAAFPNDRDRREADLKAAVEYQALASTTNQVVAEAGFQAYRLADQAFADKLSAISGLVTDTKTKVSAAAARSREKILRQPAPPLVLPAPGTAAFDALTAYVQAVQSSSDAFAHYLQSNSLATKSILGSFVSGFGENIVPAVTGALRGDAPKTIDVVKEGTALAKTLYGEVLHDHDTNGRALLDQMNTDARKAGTDLLGLARTQAQNFITAKLAGLKLGAPSAPAP